MPLRKEDVAERRLTLLEKKDIIKAHRSGITNTTKLGKMFGVDPITAERIVNHKAAKIILDVHPLVAGK